MIYSWVKPILTAEWQDEIVMYQAISGDTYYFADTLKEVIKLGLVLDHFTIDGLFELTYECIKSDDFNVEYVNFALSELLNKNLIEIRSL